MLPLRHFALRSRIGIQRSFSKGVSSLSASLHQSWRKLPDRRRKISVVFLKLFLALLLAQMSFKALGQSQLEGWLKKNPPSHRLWNHALNASGYSLVTGENRIHWITQRLDSVESSQGAWISEPWGWVAIDEGQSLRLYQRPGAGSSFPLQWSGLGASWGALERLIQILEKQDQPHLVLQKKGGDPRDPLELRY